MRVKYCLIFLSYASSQLGIFLIQDKDFCMKKILTIVALALFTVKSYSNNCALPQVPESGFQEILNIKYKGDLAFDMYLPEKTTTEALPVALLIHGGSWSSGQREWHTQEAKTLASLGYAGITTSYTLANDQGKKFPAQIEDLRCVVKSIKSLATQYNLNSDKILNIGFSAGAHLAAEIALTADSGEFSDADCPVQGYEPNVNGVVGYYGPYDLSDSREFNFFQLLVVINFLGASPDTNPAIARLASPALQIDDEALPFFLTHGDQDTSVQVKSSQEFAAALEQSNNTVEYVEIPGEGHNYRLFDSKEILQDANCGALDFIERFKGN